jgi:hypothetical protein
MGTSGDRNIHLRHLTNSTLGEFEIVETTWVSTQNELGTKEEHREDAIVFTGDILECKAYLDLLKRRLDTKKTKMKEEDKIILTAGKMWARLGLGLLLLIGVYGVLAPMLFSNSESDFGVILGMVVTWAAPFLYIWILWPVLKYTRNHMF